MNFIEPNIQINGISVEDEIIPVIPTSPRLLKKNNFGTFIRSKQKTFGNPSDNLNDAIQEVAERKSKVRDPAPNINIHNTLLQLLDPDNSEKPKKQTTVVDISGYEDILINNDDRSLKENTHQEPITRPIVNAPVETIKLVPSNNNDVLITPPIAAPEPSASEAKTVIVRRIDYSEKDKINNTDKLVATLDIFKKKYKTLKIPDYNSNTPYDKLLIYIDCAKSQVKQRKKISKYKLMLGGFFLGVELFMHYILNMDPENFTLNQLKNMDQYEIIFNELQDIGIERVIEEWSPLIRILWIMGIHIIIFFGAKMLSKIFGGDTSELQKLISGFLNGKTVEDMDIDDGDEENMISKVYGIFKAFTSSNRKKDSDGKKVSS